MNNFFVNFGTVWFQLADGTSIKLNDITKSVGIDQSWKQDPRLVLTYKIRDTDRPDKISYRIYNTDKYWWSILLINNIQNMNDEWPRNEDQFAAYLAEKYPFQDLSETHHYLNVDGNITDIEAAKFQYGMHPSTADNLVIANASLTAVDILDYETTLNEAKRDIVVVDPDQITTLETQLQALFA